MVALVGRSLSGKTSLIYTIMNFDEPLQSYELYVGLSSITQYYKDI